MNADETEKRKEGFDSEFALYLFNRAMETAEEYCKEEEKVCKSDSTAFAQGKYLGMWIMKDHFRNYWEMAFEEDQKE